MGSCCDGCWELALASEFPEACTGRTYRIDPLLATLSKLPNRARLESELVDSLLLLFRLPMAANDDEGASFLLLLLLLLLSSGKTGVLWSSITEPGEKTRDPSDPSESYGE